MSLHLTYRSITIIGLVFNYFIVIIVIIINNNIISTAHTTSRTHAHYDCQTVRATLAPLKLRPYGAI